MRDTGGRKQQNGESLHSGIVWRETRARATRRNPYTGTLQALRHNSSLRNARRLRRAAKRMTRPRAGRILTVMLDPDSSVPLHRQVYASLRTSILDGRLKPGAGLPSTRVFAAELNVSRSTIVLAYDQLRAEGYVTSKLGGRTRIADVVPESVLRSDASPARERRTRRATAIQPTHAEALKHALYVEPRVPRAFRS